MSILDESLTEQGFMTPRMRGALKVTSPWLRIIAVCGLVGTTIGLVLCVIAFIDELDSSYKRLSDFVAIGVFAAVLSLGFYLALLLLQAGNQVKRYLDSNEIGALEESFVRQRNFWVIVGVLVVLIFLGSLLMVFFIMRDLMN